MEGFIVGKGEYAAVPFGKKGYIIIHNGQQLEKNLQNRIICTKVYC